MRTYVLVEGHGEVHAVPNLLSRLAPSLGPFAVTRVPGMANEAALLRHCELFRARGDAHALLAMRDDADGCPKVDAPALATALRAKNLPFQAAIVLAYREYESLFLPCIDEMAGRPLEMPGHPPRSGLKAGTRYEGDFEARRGVKEWLSGNMTEGHRYKPTLDQLAFTRMVDFDKVRASGLPWFASLERALAFLVAHSGESAAAYPLEVSGGRPRP